MTPSAHHLVKCVGRNCSAIGRETELTKFSTIQEGKRGYLCDYHATLYRRLRGLET